MNMDMSVSSNESVTVNGTETMKNVQVFRYLLPKLA